MWTEPTKTGKVKFVEQFKNPLTLKYTRVSVTMDKKTNTTRKLAQQTLNKRIEEKLRYLEDGQIKEGNILKVEVAQGAAVKAGQLLVILEAMKMENEIVAPKDGTVAQVVVKVGDKVDTGAALVILA